MIERTHTEDYALALTGLRVGEWARINGRHYGVFEEGYNPNKGAEINFESTKLSGE